MDPAHDSERRRLRSLVEEELQKLDTSYRAESAPAVAVTAYHRAAAVLATFDTTLNPDGTPGDGETVEHALVDAEPVVHASQLRFQLMPDVRRRVLESLRSPDAMQRARAANPDAPRDSLQVMFDKTIAGVAPPLDRQNVTELAASFEVVRWLHGLLPGVPTTEEVRTRIEMETLLSPFEDLVGAHFGGRERELMNLRDYVGVLEPSTFVEGVWRGVREVFSLHEKPPLVIYGPGGYGKSTLLARFILEHGRLDDRRRFPFVYIDFDRATIAADEPLTILVEAVRQLGIQYVHAQRRSDELRDSWRRRMGRIRRRPSDASALAGDSTATRARRERAPYIQDFASFAQSLELDDRPMLLVLDTFEEVQRRSTAFVRELWLFLAELQKANPRLRTVLSGRAPVTGVGFNNEPLATELRQLGRLDVDAAAAVLEKQGIPHDLARRVASRVGGSPLTLKLAAQLVKQSATTPGGKIEDEFDENALEQAVADGEIERYLYTRILEHISDERVRVLAHPGLVLRRVTADLIYRVLAEPCGLDVKSEAEAVPLLSGLRLEVALVTPADEPGTVRHRADLRQLMLRFMERTETGRVNEIHRRAVAYYQARKKATPVERAEELYHRLALGEYGPELDARWLPGVEAYLFSALEELPPAPRTWLASRLRVELSPEDRIHASLEVWERDAERRARELLALHQPEAALHVLHERVERSASSPLYRVEADVLIELGRLDGAIETLDRGVAHAFEWGSDALRTELQISAAKLDVARGFPGRAHSRLDEVEPVAIRRHDTAQLMDIAMVRLDAQRAEHREMDPPARATPTQQLLAWFSETTDDQLIANPGVARRVAAEVASVDDGALVRAIKLVGIGSPDRHQLRDLGEALSDWDRQLAADDPSDATWLRGVTPLTRLANLTDAAERNWVSFALTAPLPDIDAGVRRIVRQYRPPERVAAVLTHMLGGPPKPSSDAHGRTALATPGTTVVRQSLVTKRFESRTVDALTVAFSSRREIERLVEYRFNRSLNAITHEGNLQKTVHDLLKTANAEGWGTDLLLAAHRSKPQNWALREVVEDLGLLTPTARLLKRIAQPGEDLEKLSAKLTGLEGRVCRIEVTTKESQAYASGFLVSPDVVLTVAPVVNPVSSGKTSVDSVQVRFDLLGQADAEGTVYGLDPSRWLVARGKLEKGGFELACIRVADQPGREPLGGERSLPDAPPRGWIQLPDQPPEIAIGQAIVLLHYARTEPLEATLVEHGVEKLVSAREMHYRASTPAGAGGAPIFDVRLNLIGLHLGTAPGWRNFGMRKGLPLGAIVEWLRGAGDEAARLLKPPESQHR